MVEIVYKYVNEFIDENELIKSLECLDLSDFSEKQIKDIKKLIEDVKNVLNEGRGETPTFSNVYPLVTENKTYLNLCKKMSVKEVMELVTSSVKSPNPPNIDQEYFDDMVDEAVKLESPEKVWRLGVSYSNYYNMKKVEDYFISKRDGFYLFEYISIVYMSEEKINNLLDKVIKTKDKKFINELLDANKKFDELSDDQIRKLKKEYDG